MYTIAVAELTFLIISPALDGVVVEERACMNTTGGDVLSRATSAVVDRGEVVAHFVRGVAAVRRIAEAELTIAVITPALDVAVVEERARVRIPSGHDNSADSRGERRGRRNRRCDEHTRFA